MIDVFFLPFAGGTSLIYEGWKFSSEINPICLDYSGHGFRMKEPLYDSFDEMVNDIKERIYEKKKNNSVALFGHSMGGLVAWDVTKRLVEEGCTVRHVFISSCLPPHLFKESLYEEMSTEEWQNNFLLQYGRISTTRMESHFFREKIFPAIINDYKLIAFHKHEEKQTICSDLACFYGLQDDLMPYKGMNSWRNYTKRDYFEKGFSGDHFYLENELNAEEIISVIEKRLTAKKADKNNSC